MNPTLEKYLSVLFGAGLAVLAVQPFAAGAKEVLLIAAGGLLGYVVPNAGSRQAIRDAKNVRSMSIPPTALLFLLVLLPLAHACGGLGDTPSADTLKGIDEVCAARAENREAFDAAARLADQQARELGEQPQAAPAPADAVPGGPGVAGQADAVAPSSPAPEAGAAEPAP